MKTAFLLFFFLIIAFSLKSYGALPPTTLSGMNDTTKTTTFNFKVPNKQATKVTGGTLIETGNTNRLINPGFEHSTIWSGWATGCTGTATLYMGGSSLKYEGKQVLEFEVIGGASGGQCTIYQNAETVAVDGVVAIAIHSENASGVKVLKKTNIYDIALEKDILGKSEWQKIELVGKLGSSETGVAIEVTVGASETKEVHIDEAKVAIADTKQVTPQMSDWKPYPAQLIDGAGTPITNVTATASYRQVGDSIDIDFTAVFIGTPAPFGNMAITLPSGLVISSEANPSRQLTGPYTDASAGIENPVAAFPIPVANHIRLRSSFVNTSDSGSSVDLVSIANDISNTSPFTVAVNDSVRVAVRGVKIQGWSATTEVYSTEADFFSTDTNTLTFKGTAITDSDPVGTFNTYSYAANTNTKTICGTAPTQSIASMKTNGIQIFTRAYNAASTCANPARVEVKLGKGMTVVTPSLYKSAGKSISGKLDTFGATSNEAGPRINSYDSSLGVYILDAGLRGGDNVNASFGFSDTSFAASGYLVIDAQPKKTTAVVDLKGFVKSQGATSEVDIQSVYFGSGADCSLACTTGTCTICTQVGSKITSVVREATAGVYRLLGINGRKYICSGAGFAGSYKTAVHNKLASTSTYAVIDTESSDTGFLSVTCIGQP